MGQWGIATYSGDSPMDYLQHHIDDGNLDKMTQEIADDTIKDVFKSGEDFDKLGVVVWLIINGFRVVTYRLKEALKIANDELKEVNLRNWGEEEERKAMVVIEMNDIRYAIEHGGISKKRDEVALSEKAIEAIASLPQTIKLPCYGIVVELTDLELHALTPNRYGGGSITSDMHETCSYCNDSNCDMGCSEFFEHCSDRDYGIQLSKQAERYEFLAHRAAIDALESIIMGHACAGIDITTPAYLEGIETAMNALMNADYSVEPLG